MAVMPGSMQRQFDRGPQFIRLIGLKHIAGRRGDLRPFQRVVVGIGRQVDDGHILFPLDLAGGFDSIHFSLQYDVHQNQVGMRVAGLADRVFAGRGGGRNPIAQPL